RFEPRVQVVRVPVPHALAVGERIRLRAALHRVVNDDQVGTHARDRAADTGRPHAAAVQRLPVVHGRALFGDGHLLTHDPADFAGEFLGERLAVGADDDAGAGIASEPPGRVADRDGFTLPV